MRRYQTRLFAFLQKIGGLSQVETEDLVQETFLRAYSRLEKFNFTEYSSNNAFGAWLFSIGRRIWLNHLREEKKQKYVFFSDNSDVSSQIQSVPDNQPKPDEGFIQTDARAFFWDKLKRYVTEPQWTALWLKYVEEYTIAEIAASLGKNQQSVKALLHRARLGLQNHPDIIQS